MIVFFCELKLVSFYYIIVLFYKTLRLKNFKRSKNKLIIDRAQNSFHKAI